MLVAPAEAWSKGKNPKREVRSCCGSLKPRWVVARVRWPPNDPPAGPSARAHASSGLTSCESILESSCKALLHAGSPLARYGTFRHSATFFVSQCTSPLYGAAIACQCTPPCYLPRCLWSVPLPSIIEKSWQLPEVSSMTEIGKIT